MISVQITSGRPTFKLPSITCCPPFLQCCSPNQPLIFSESIKLAIKASAPRQCKPVSLFGGKGKGNSADSNEGSPWKSLDNAFGSSKKEKSVEEQLRLQIEKQEYYDDGGGMGDPPYSGGRGNSGSSGDDGGESEEEALAGVLDETLQVFLATFGFIFLYIYIITGEEIALLLRDYIKYVFGGTMSVRLRQAMEWWKRFWEKITVTEEEEDPRWLEKEIINTSTWWDSPDKYRRMAQKYGGPDSSSNRWS